MLSEKLIENALALCEYMYDDFTDEIYRGDSYSFSGEYCGPKIEQKFSIEKFYAFLLSKEFISKYTEDKDMNWAECSQLFGNAIYEYQAGLEEPLIELLSKIGN